MPTDGSDDPEFGGVAPPLVTPFDDRGDVDHDALRELVARLEDRGVDFLVPCGSTSEAELMTADERRRVVETVADAASVPVLAGTGSPGLRETERATAAAAEAGADAALVVTPFYYNHDQATFEAYYRKLADRAPVPVYLYSVPAYTDAALTAATVGRLAEHPGIAGIKDSAGDVGKLVRTVERTADAEFDVLVGSASVFAQALDAGAVGGIMALANLAPSELSAIVDEHASDPAAAREHNERLVRLNRAITSRFGVPGLKWAMRQRGLPAGYPRAPFTEPDAEATATIETLLKRIR